MLGGMAAERIRYGTTGVSTGSASDLHMATEFALSMAKEHGMTGDLLSHAHHPSTAMNGFRTGLQESEAQVRHWMEQAEKLAMTTLQVEQELLFTLAKELADKGSLGAKALNALVRPASVDMGLATHVSVNASCS